MTPSLRTSSAAYFYPRPPRGGRPAVAGHRPLDERISIHALREEGDATGCLCVSVSHNFYPRPPRGGRRNLLASLADGILFLSTPSARRATVPRLSGFVEVTISIHALREEGDRSASYRASPSGYFYPRPPRGGRHDPKRVGGQKDVFLSTPSARRATSSICGVGVA